MILKFAKILVFTLKFLEKIIFEPINKKLLVFIKKVLEDSSYKTKKANGKDLLFLFFCIIIFRKRALYIN